MARIREAVDRGADRANSIPERVARLGGYALVGLVLACLPRASGAQNVIVVIADDIGAEWFTAYGEQAGNAPTPTIDSLAAQGVLFRSAWAYPVCSPFRVSAYTGRHPAQHGAGTGINPNDDAHDYVLDPGVPNLGNLLGAAGYRTAALGKWHMAAELGFTGTDLWDGIVSVTEEHPNLAGMQYFSGYLFGGADYFSWPKTIDGVSTWVHDYATTDTADAAIAALPGSEPFFLWVAFTAPHAPLHEPPLELLADPSIYDLATAVDKYRAMTEAMDTELGRLLQGVDLTDTTVIFVGDNGSTLYRPPRLSTHGKATVYEGGVHVPLIVAGQAVALAARGRESRALVQATDLFPTILELGGLDPPTRPDAVSILPYLSDPEAPAQRQTVYTEMFTPNGGPIDPEAHHRAARELRYKLIRRGTQPDELYDLELDPYELSPLDLSVLTPEQQGVHDTLDQAILARRPAACENGLDDDGDGLVDRGADPGCDDASDASERSDALVCDDGLDNDGDAAVDYPADAGCSSLLDASESTACSNGLEDDGDGLTDFPDDPGCADALDDSERSDSLVCDDGLDNDGDGLVDFSPTPGDGDPGCFDPSSFLENPQCQDGINNDPGLDSLIDFDGGAAAGVPQEQQTDLDPQCAGAPWRDLEAPGVQASWGCGIGPELLLLGLGLAARGRCRWRETSSGS